ncbi:hypothetical protein [Candidatus Methylomirabilis sp.]
MRRITCRTVRTRQRYRDGADPVKTADRAFYPLLSWAQSEVFSFVA